MNCCNLLTLSIYAHIYSENIAHQGECIKWLIKIKNKFLIFKTIAIPDSSSTRSKDKNFMFIKNCCLIVIFTFFNFIILWLNKAIVTIQHSGPDSSIGRVLNILIQTFKDRDTFSVSQKNYKKLDVFSNQFDCVKVKKL